MGIEQRKSKRSDINVTVSLTPISDNHEQADREYQETKEVISVQLYNISEDGLAFTTNQELDKRTVGYGVNIHLANGQKFEEVIQVVRVEEQENNEKLYGCRFIGMNDTERFNIAIYQAMHDNNII